MLRKLVVPPPPIVKIKIHVSVHVKHYEQVEHIHIANECLRQEQYYTNV